MNRINSISYNKQELGEPIKKNPINDNSVNYLQSNNENYWFQDISGTLLNLDYLIKIIPNNEMTYPEKINSLVRLSIYIGLILSLFYANYLFLYVPVIVMLVTYILYLFRIEQYENIRAERGPNAKLNSLTNSNNLMYKLMGSNANTKNEKFENILNISHCNPPTSNNPFMNPLIFDSRLRDNACDAIKPENQLSIEREYNKYCIKDISDIWNHNSGRRQFYTVANTTFPNDQGSFANWLYKVPPTCKEGNGAQCVANLPYRINSDLISPSFSQ